MTPTNMSIENPPPRAKRDRVGGVDAAVAAVVGAVGARKRA